MTDSKLILVVEDDDAIREVMRDTLEEEGYSVVTAANGCEALAALRTPGGGHPGVILLDVGMPVMDGRAFRSEQLKDAALAAIPVVVLSADASVRAKAEALQAASYLKKPLRLDVLLSTVRICIER